MTDRYANTISGLDAPGVRHYAITPADTNLVPRPRAFFVTVSGNLIIRDEVNTDITYPVNAGDIIPFRGMQVRIGTTATVVGWD